LLNLLPDTFKQIQKVKILTCPFLTTNFISTAISALTSIPYWDIILILLLFVVIPTFIIKKLAPNIDTYGKICLMTRTKHGLKTLDRLAKHERFWNGFGDLGIIMAFGGLGSLYLLHLYKKQYSMAKKAGVFAVTSIANGLFFGGLISALNMSNTISFAVIPLTIAGAVGGFALFGVGMLATQAIIIISTLAAGQKALPGIAPIIPGMKIPKTDFVVPFAEGWIALISLMIVHELAHGILSRVAKVKVQSLGLVTLGIIPIGAFTEPDEKELMEKPALEQQRMYAAGSMANFAAMAVLIVILMGTLFTLGPAFSEVYNKNVTGLEITGLDETALASTGETPPALEVLEKGMVIESINGKTIKTRNDLEELKPNLAVGSSAVFKIKGYDEPFMLEINQEKRFGIFVNEMLSGPLPFSLTVYFFIVSLLSWMILLNFAVGMVNFIPMEPFDGGKMTSLALGAFITKKFNINEIKAQELVSRTSLIVVLSILLLNALPLFL